MNRRIVRLTAPWCGPCKDMEKIMEVVKTNLPSITYEVVDVDKDPTLQIQTRASIPALLIYNSNGHLHRTLSGLRTANEIIEEVSKVA